MVKLLLDVMKLIQPATTVVFGVKHELNANQVLDIILFYGIAVQDFSPMDVPSLLPSTFIGEVIFAASAVSIRTVSGECLNVFHRQYCS